jgi:hypothetical protein
MEQQQYCVRRDVMNTTSPRVYPTGATLVLENGRSVARQLASMTLSFSGYKVRDVPA